MKGTITIKSTMQLGLAGCRPVTPFEALERDGVKVVKIQYLNGGRWEEGEIPRIILQDLADTQALRLELARKRGAA